MIKISSPIIPEDAIVQVGELMRSGALRAGPFVAQFESSFAEYVGCRFGIATSSGTAALLTALWTVGIRPGDVVITAPFSFIATANAIVALGATPLFCDVDLKSGNMNPTALVEMIVRVKPRAVLVVHLYGNPMDLQDVQEACQRNRVKLVEDCAQAHGAVTDCGPAGSVGDAAAFSFYATKNLAIGEGGMVTTNDPAVARRARLYINHGSDKMYHHVQFGLNYRMMEWQGLIGLKGLERLMENNRSRVMNAHRIRQAIVGRKFSVVSTAGSVYHQLTLRTPHRAQLAEWLQERGVGYAIYYPTTIPDQPTFRAKTVDQSFVNARKLAEEVISVPVHPALTSDECELVARSLGDFDPG